MSVSISLDKLTALVTGGSSGLGPHIVQRLDEAGARVAIHYHRNEAGAAEVASKLSQSAELIQADLGNESDVRNLFTKAVDAFGPVHILVNCAAAESQHISDLAELSHERWKTTQQANVDAPLLLTQMFAAQGTPGSVINISSIEGTRPAVGHAHYATSKAALEMLTKACALEYGAAGVRVNAVAPGLIWREGIEDGWPEGVNSWKDSAPLGKLVQPADVANAVLYLASDAANTVTGIVLTVDSGMSIQPGW